MPPPYKISSQLSNKSIQKYTAPKDKKLSTVSSLSDAFGGWLQKANYNIFNKRSTKKKYFILANLMIYIFKNDLSDTEYEDSLPITKESLITKKLDQNFTLDFLTKFLVENVLIIMGEGRRVEMVEKSRRLELTCSDAIELNCWLDCFNEAIKEAQDGREPLVFNDLTSTISNDTQ
ncbi:hypothetical protein HDU92_006895 [Lobulomyces angularis]|nr:hypothetical protein HDU92_006895 [Lobulomyces angularis]